ncbi:MAG: lamin tail domain-containing protein [Patescibacteria group bacterium]
MSRNVSVFMFSLVALLAPSAAHAAVVISEVAWMGTSVSASAEWIELQNTDATPVSLVGWTLVSSTGAPAITLSGTIAASGFFLLERTSDSSVPTVTADQIYSGALSNSGATLTLKDSTGTVVDTVVGGTDWQSIGGDNTTKHTPQRTGSTWSTAAATPRASTASVSSTATTTTSTSTEDTMTPQTSIGGNPLVLTAPVVPKLFISAGPGRIVSVGATVPYAARVYDDAGAVRNDVNIVWSFGDGETKSGRAVEHVFVHPGTYLVVVHASSGVSQVSTALTVEAVRPLVEIVTSDASGITLYNSSSGILDLSYWKLVSGGTAFTFPLFTALLPKKQVTFPVSVTGLTATSSALSLLFPNGKTVTTFATSSEIAAVSEAPRVQPFVLPRGIQEVEAVAPPVSTNASTTYGPQSLAPSAPVTSGALGASASLFKSPWTASFFGLLVAAGTILAIL